MQAGGHRFDSCVRKMTAGCDGESLWLPCWGIRSRLALGADSASLAESISKFQVKVRHPVTKTKRKAGTVGQ